VGPYDTVSGSWVKPSLNPMKWSKFDSNLF
jgi:hypothetical protein